MIHLETLISRDFPKYKKKCSLFIGFQQKISMSHHFQMISSWFAPSKPPFSPWKTHGFPPKDPATAPCPAASRRRRAPGRPFCANAPPSDRPGAPGRLEADTKRAGRCGKKKLRMILIYIYLYRYHIYHIYILYIHIYVSSLQYNRKSVGTSIILYIWK